MTLLDDAALRCDLDRGPYDINVVCGLGCPFAGQSSV
jgi:hypothetical protein